MRRALWLLGGMVLTGCEAAVLPPTDGMPDTQAPLAATDPPVDDSDVPPVVPTSLRLRHRLSVVELRNTLRDVLGVEVDPAGFLPEDVERHGFTHLDGATGVSSAWLDGAAALSAAVVDEVLATERVVPAAPQVVVVPAEELPWTRGFASPYVGYFDKVWWILDTATEAEAQLHVPRAGTWDVDVIMLLDAWPGATQSAEVWLDGTLLGSASWSRAWGDEDRTPPLHALTQQRVLSEGTHTLVVTASAAAAQSWGPYVPGMPRIMQGPLTAVDAVRLTEPGAVDTVDPAPQARADFLTCDPVVLGEATCAEQILARVGRGLWRRPVPRSSMGRLLSLVTEARGLGLAFDEAMGTALQALLLSPHTHYRVDVGPDELDEDGVWLAPYAAAARLSYALWQSAPDEALLGCADQGLLGSGEDPCDVPAQVRRMMDDPRAHVLADELGLRWLGVHALDRYWLDVRSYLRWSPQLVADLLTETTSVLREQIVTGADLRTLVTLDHTRINPRLGILYDVPAPDPGGFAEVSLAGTPRRGILTHGSVLMASAGGSVPTPVDRAVWVLEHLLCREPPAPPPNVAQLPQLNVGDDAAAVMDAHASAPACSGCHAQIDPYGEPQSDFDLLGVHKPLGRLPVDLPDGVTIGDVAALGTWLTTSEEHAACITETVATWALGRQMVPADAALLADVQATALSDGLSLEALLVAVLSHDLVLSGEAEP